MVRLRKCLLHTSPAQFSDTQFKWSAVVKEGYAIYYAIKKWRHYLDDADILLKTDENLLKNFCMAELTTINLDRWSL